ncbi:rhomboid family intramembrane serine protease [Sporolactobacillus sp. THM7-4]|nr:rhomboid family intramembrane serine protease [Sporolactobacillus sp. THM7-4]
MFIRNESFKIFLRRYPVTSIILAVDILIYVVFFISGRVAPFFAFHAFQYMAGVNTMILQGSWWQLVTPIFLHITFSHILFNAFSIFIFAPALETMLGRTKFMIAFLGTGIISNVAALFLEPPDFSHYGASAAVFGLMGFYLYLVVFRRHMVSQQDRTIIIVMLVISLLSSFAYPNIDIVGHLTGFLSGLLLAPLLFTGSSAH